MKLVKKYWKVLFALLLVAAAALTYFKVYEEEKAAYEAAVKQFYINKDRFNYHYNITTELQGR